MSQNTPSGQMCPPGTRQQNLPSMARPVAGATTGAIFGGMVAGLAGAAFGGIAGFLIGFTTTEDERRYNE